MKTLAYNPITFESTYALLVRSEEKQRNRFETLAYSLLMASTIFAVSEFGRQPVAMPSSIRHAAAADISWAERST